MPFHVAGLYMICVTLYQGVRAQVRATAGPADAIRGSAEAPGAQHAQSLHSADASPSLPMRFGPTEWQQSLGPPADSLVICETPAGPTHTSHAQADYSAARPSGADAMPMPASASERQPRQCSQQGGVDMPPSDGKGQELVQPEASLIADVGAAAAAVPQPWQVVQLAASADGR